MFYPLVILEKLWHNLKTATRSLWLQKLRTFLSVLGIIIGTAAVISLMSFGEGSMHEALEKIKEMGATNIIIRSVKPVNEESVSSASFFANYGLDEKDLDRITNISTVTRAVPLRIFRQQMAYRGENHMGRVVGTTRAYADVHKFQLASGRFLTDEENLEMKNNAVIGSELAERLFPVESPLGKLIRIDLSAGKPLAFTVVGVVKPRMPTGGTGGSQAAEQFNSDMYIPIETCNARFGERIYFQEAGSRTGEQVVFHQITLTVDSMDNVKETANIIRTLLESKTGRRSKDWAMTIPLDKLEEAEETKERYLTMLFAIAFITVFVGGIGIMNIMLASVTERIREIGVRRALGAKQRDIIVQFLTEAVVQTIIGGLLGVIFGIAAVYASPFVWEWLTSDPLPSKLHVWSIFIAVAAAVVVGVLAGLYPAIKAAKLDPIEALRHI